MNELVAKIFERRGYTDEFIRNLDRSDHCAPSNIDELCVRLREYRLSARNITLFTDFDMDGIMCGVVGLAGLSELGFTVRLHIPEHQDSYGFKIEDVDDIIARDNADGHESAAILTADVGIVAYDAGNYARSRGFDVFVTDHHQPDGGDISVFSVAVDPWLDPNDDEHFNDRCGAYMLYMVLRRYVELYENTPYMIQQIDRLRVFAGIGTVSDSMPMLYENRGLVRDAVAICRFVYGKDSLRDGEIYGIFGNDPYRRAFRGLGAVLRKFIDTNRLRSVDTLDETFFGYYLAPMFNSLKRMERSVELAYRVFFGSYDVTKASVDELFELNEKRKQVVQEKYEGLFTTPQPWSPYVYITDAASGLCGLLAQRVRSEMTDGPVFVVHVMEDGSYAGSARGPEWFDILSFCAGFAGAGAAGHKVACGVFFESDSVFADFCTELNAVVSALRPSEDVTEYRPDLLISNIDPDADCGFDNEVLSEFVSALDAYRPFGPQFPDVDIEFKFEPRSAVWRFINKDRKHVKAALPDGIELLCFNQGFMFPEGDIDPAQMPPVISVRGSMSFNDYGGTRQLQIKGQLPMLFAADPLEEAADVDVDVMEF